MGNSAEWIAREYQLTREELDRFALESQRKASAAIDSGEFREEIVALDLPQPKGNSAALRADEAPRRDTTIGGAGPAQAGLREGGRGHRRQWTRASPMARPRSW